MHKATAVLLLLINVFIPLKAQKIVPDATDLYNDATEYMLSGDYKEALALYLSLGEKGYHTENISYLTGECYLNIQGQKTKAIPYLKEAVENISDKWNGKSLEEEPAPDKAWLYLGISYRINNDFDNALKSFNKYLEVVDDVDTDNIALANFHISRCNFAKEMMASPMRYTTDTLPDYLNTTVSNINPLVTSDEKIILYMDQLKFYDAIMKAVSRDGIWQNPVNLTPEIRSDGDHYITGISADGNKLFLTSYDPYFSGEIYTTEYKNGEWSRLQRLGGEINTRFNESHASVSPDGKTLYFTSDRKGGFGGMDIYRSSIFADGTFGTPENLGPLVNTPYNEACPFVSSDAKKLFFSSQGHYNMGGYDIFFSSGDSSGNWMSPVNIGYPVNTTDDDLFFFPVGSGDIAYQSRFSLKSGQMDIIRFAIGAFSNPVRFTINGRIDVQAYQGYDPSSISIAFIDAANNDTLNRKTLQRDGTFMQKLPAGNWKLDFSNKAGNLLTKKLDIPLNLPLNDLLLYETITITPPMVVLDTLTVKNLHFDFDKSILQESSLTYLNEIARLMVKYPELNLKIAGFADAVGDRSYNIRLSQYRADRVYDYLKSRGELSGRITTEALGELNPVAKNINEDGTDNPLGRSLNRRVELIFSNIPENLIVVKFSGVQPGLRVE
jgi:outer membrane protein OmpA-like peptidoglycan-associated protein/tetratricopeptide (TPR) repeat protein